jgi:phage portal protein BeeE
MAWFNFTNKEKRNSVTVEDDSHYSITSGIEQSFISNVRESRSLAAVYACVELITNALSCIPLRVIQKSDDEVITPIKHHPVQRIFKNKNIQTLSIQ